ncbi:MAG: NfeD family protein [Desulfatibacillaceae bacterium]
MEALNAWFDPTYFWLIIGVVLILVEVVNPGLILVFFGLGAFATAVVCRAVDIGITAQLLVFLVSSLLLMLALRSWLRDVFGGKLAGDGSPDDDHVVGRRAVVTQAIAPHSPGRVELHGSTWSAEADREIPEGTPVEVTGKQSITLHVRPLARS